MHSARLFFILLFVSGSVSVLNAASKKFEQRFTAGPDGALMVKTDVGAVFISGTASNEVSILAEWRGSAKDVEDFEVLANQTGNVVEVKGRGVSRSWWSWGFDDPEVRITVQVPQNHSLDINTSGGDISVQNVAGRMTAETSGGDVILKKLSGKMLISTSGGDIKVEDIEGDFKGETSGGDVVIVGSKGNTDAGTSGGDVRITGGEGKLRAETSGGDIIIVLTGQNKGIVAETSGGDIEIVVDKDVRANIDASTSGGSVSCLLPITLSGAIDESEVRGTVNGGGETIWAHTSGGDVRIKAGP